jgi:hypothetical protein
MNSKTLRTLTLSALVMTLAFVAFLSVAPDAHAAAAGAQAEVHRSIPVSFSIPYGKPDPSGSSIGTVRYGPSAGTQPMSGISGKTAQPDASAYCFAEVVAWKQTSIQVGAWSYTDCTPGAYQITQVLSFSHCILYINGCQEWQWITNRNCNTGTGGIYTYAYCPPNPNNNFYINFSQGWLIQVYLTSCADIITAGWWCGYTWTTVQL